MSTDLTYYKDAYAFCDVYKHISVASSESIKVRVPVGNIKNLCFNFELYGSWQVACQAALDFRNAQYLRYGYNDYLEVKKTTRNRRRNVSNTGVTFVSRAKAKGSKKFALKYMRYRMDGKKRVQFRTWRVVRGDENTELTHISLAVRRNRIEFARDTDNISDLYPIRVAELEEIFEGFSVGGLTGKTVTIVVRDINTIFQLLYPRIYEEGVLPGVKTHVKAEVRRKLLQVWKDWKRIDSNRLNGMIREDDTKWLLKDRRVYVSLKGAVPDGSGVKVPFEDFQLTL
ncbi:MAG: hypothetical protein GY861_20695 [bacterium]|nr:hypothetical protein [bacterium]